jgi:uncharacterized cofD-like protein
MLGAELIVAGPGSLFTSVLPNLLIREIREALVASRALKIYVCNVATQPGETDGFSVGDHLEAIQRHIGAQPFHAVLANKSPAGALPEGMEWVAGPLPEGRVTVIREDLADGGNAGHHDPQKLAAALMDLLARRAVLFPT